MENFTELLNEMNDSSYWYLDGIKDSLATITEDRIFKDCKLFHVEQLIYEPSEFYLSAFEHILNSVCTKGIIFLMLILKTKNGLDFYYGVAPETKADKKSAAEAAEILEAEFEAVFLEAELTKVEKKETERILDYAQSFSFAASLEGIPGIPEKQKSMLSQSRFQRLLKEDNYAVVLVAKPLQKQSTEQVEEGIQYIYNSLFSFVSRTKSFEETDVSTTSGTINVAGNDSCNCNQNRPIVLKGKEGGAEENQEVIHKNCTTNKGQSLNNSISKTVVHTSRCTNLSQSTVGAFGIKAWLDFVGKTLAERVQYGKVNGIFVYRLMLYTETVPNMKKLEMLLKKNCYGDVSTLIPVRLSWHPKDKIPGLLSCKKTERMQKEYRIRNTFSQIVSPNGSDAGTWVTGRELSALVALPQITKEQVQTEVCYPVLVTGDRGSLKSETALAMIKKADCPFFAIEVIGEKYRTYKKQEIETAVFKVYDNNRLFHMNPLAIFPGETKQSHMQMLIICFALSFHFSEELLTVLLEALRQCYRKHEHPLLIDLVHEAETIILEQLNPVVVDSYLSIVRQTLLTLCNNEKGRIYNTEHSFDFITWVRQPTVIELESVIDAREKVFLMSLLTFGVISGTQYLKKKEKDFSHILLIEEAHRLFDARMEYDYVYGRYFQSAIDLVTCASNQGEKILFTEPFPTQIPDAIYRLSATKMIHKVSSNQAKNRLVECTGLTRDDLEKLGTLKKGKKIIQI